MPLKTWRSVVILSAFVIVFVYSTQVEQIRAEESQRPVIPEKIEFNRDVRPILSENCFICHGPDAGKRQADLRLDTQDGLFGNSSKVKPIVANSLTESELYRRISTDSADDLMPPVDSGRKLSDRDKLILKKWIEQGAQYQGHWSYLSPVAPVVPEVASSQFIRNDCDRFIQSKTQQVGLKQSVEADRVTLIRRLSFDLTGLPPSADRVERFVQDSDPKAYENLVEELLSSPHFGERMAVYWLDLVRFADTAGYHSDNPRDITPYRDYVISSFNNNLPFDQFTVEQLAGDLLPGSTVQQKVASGYNRLLQTTEEGGAQAKEYIAKYAADRVRNVAAVWLGATMGCAECHDHKYDPFTQRDFYSMAAFFADIEEVAVGRREPGLPVPSAAEETELKRLNDAISAANKDFEEAMEKLTATNPDWNELLQLKSLWQLAEVKENASESEAALKKLEDGTFQSLSNSVSIKSYPLEIVTKGSVTGLRLTVLSDSDLPSKGPGTGNDGNFVLTEFKVSTIGEDGSTKSAKVTKAIADHSQSGHDVAASIDGRDGTGWAILPQAGQSHEAVFELAEPISAGRLSVSLEFKSPTDGQRIGRFRIETTTVPEPSIRWASPLVRTAIEKQRSERDEADRKTIHDYLRDRSVRFNAERSVVQTKTSERDAFAKLIPGSLITKVAAPRMVRILPRGNWLDESGEIVLPAIPAFLGKVQTSESRATRLDLAQWVVSEGNPLTARVFVNRTWKLLFGQGLSRSMEDFGSQGEWPTHPELLDYLTLRFRESGWNVKDLIRQIVTSGTYRQSSVLSKESRSIDPFNRYLTAQNRGRLDAEFVRDTALSIGGLLSQRIGGESDRPYQPDGYWDYLNFPRRTWEADRGERQYRRGIYTWWQRSFLHPSLVAFDAPSREECIADRPRSNTPQQALTLLNDPSYVEAARSFAIRILKNGGADDRARIQWAFRQAISRSPNEMEMTVVQKLIEKHLTNYRELPEEAEKVVRVEGSTLPMDLKAIEVATWTSVARLLLNLHETITRM